LPSVLILLAAAQSLDVPIACLIKGLIDDAITIAVASFLILVLCVSRAACEQGCDQKDGCRLHGFSVEVA
jgi:hypothetical protein